MAILRWRGPFYESLKEFRELDHLQDEVNRLYESFFGRRPFSERPDVFPAINVSEDHDNLYVSAELPGVEAKDVDITVEEDSLTIKGVRRVEPDYEGVSYHRREREGGGFNRKISLQTRIVTEKVKAEMKDGVLTVVMPKAEDVKPTTIDIKVQKGEEHDKQ
jgi:HSP20 family protein